MKRTEDALSKTGSVDTVYSGIKKILEEARSTAYRAVNFAMVQAYWNIGRLIVEEEQKGKSKAGYGDKLITELSLRLTSEFGKGFTQTNLRYMRLFYFSFEMVNASGSVSLPDKIHHALRDELPSITPELSWTHYRFLLKIEKPDIRKFYMDECIQSNWSTRQLERQINSFYYERLLSSKSKKRQR